VGWGRPRVRGEGRGATSGPGRRKTMRTEPPSLVATFPRRRFGESSLGPRGAALPGLRSKMADGWRPAEDEEEVAVGGGGVRGDYRGWVGGGEGRGAKGRGFRHRARRPLLRSSASNYGLRGYLVNRHEMVKTLKNPPMMRPGINFRSLSLSLSRHPDRKTQHPAALSYVPFLATFFLYSLHRFFSPSPSPSSFSSSSALPPTPGRVQSLAGTSIGIYTREAIDCAINEKCFSLNMMIRYSLLSSHRRLILWRAREGRQSTFFILSL
jgi:hypothetical protein